MSPRRKKGPTLNPFAQVDDKLSPLAEFVLSCEDEIPYLDAIREYQNDWCEHPAWRTVATNYQPYHEHYSYFRRCEECGLVEKKNGRAARVA